MTEPSRPESSPFDEHTWPRANSPGQGVNRPNVVSAQIDTQQPLRERAQRLVEFHATLLALTPRVFVTHAIIAANLVTFVLMVIGEPKAFMSPSIESLIFWGANYGPLTLNGQWWRLFSSMFLHIGVLHLALNMWVLWNIGPLVERIVGNVGFAILYVAAGLCGSLVSLAWNSQVPSAGASGAVFGLFGGLLGFLVLGRGSMPKEFVVEFRSSAFTFIGLNLVFGFTNARIDNAGHIGGLLGGCACGLLLGQPLTIHSGDYRWLRNLLLVVVAGGGVAGAALLMPRPFDIDGFMREWTADEEKLMDKFSEIMRDAKTENLSDTQCADRIERDVLTPWTRLRERLEKLEDVPAGLEPLVESFRNYARAREEFWKLAVEVNRNSLPNADAQLDEQAKKVANALQEIERVNNELRNGNH